MDTRRSLVYEVNCFSCWLKRSLASSVCVKVSIVSPSQIYIKRSRQCRPRYIIARSISRFFWFASLFLQRIRNQSQELVPWWALGFGQHTRFVILYPRPNVGPQSVFIAYWKEHCPDTNFTECRAFKWARRQAKIFFVPKKRSACALFSRVNSGRLKYQIIRNGTVSPNVWSLALVKRCRPTLPVDNAVQPRVHHVHINVWGFGLGFGIALWFILCQKPNPSPTRHH